MAYDPKPHQAKLEATVAALRTKKRILFLTTSNRWSHDETEQPKSTLLAHAIAQRLGGVEIIDIPSLKIHPCEGNVSGRDGNTCGLKGSALLDKEKNPSGEHRCWASINNPDDELWRVSKPLLAADAVVFFTSVRWGQTNVHYQQLIERLTWLENRHSTLGEENLLSHICAGVIVVGQNWHGADTLKTQKQVLAFFGFDVKDALCWNWQYTDDAKEESEASYLDGVAAFEATFLNKTTKQ